MKNVPINWLTSPCVRIISICAFLAGCTAPVSITETTPGEPPTPVAPLEVSETIAEPDVPDEVVTEPAWTQAAVILSNDIPAYGAIAEHLEHELGPDRVTVLSLSGQRSNGPQVISAVGAMGADRIVAVGSLAASVGAEIDEVPMTFCQVFDFHDRGLLSGDNTGVNFLPPFELQLETWKRLSPDLESVGVIVGPDQDGLLAEIESACDRHGVRLVSYVVGSDKEALYTFKRLVPQIQGFWLLPDHRVLSPMVIREIMLYGARHKRQMVVFNPKLLSLGGLMSFSSDYADIAGKVIAQLDRPTALDRERMVPLAEMLVEINTAVVAILGLAVPEQQPPLVRAD
jgi:ABC-type uncharacterized transport system substrate-binding protein